MPANAHIFGKIQARNRSRKAIGSWKEWRAHRHGLGYRSGVIVRHRVPARPLRPQVVVVPYPHARSRHARAGCGERLIPLVGVADGGGDFLRGVDKARAEHRVPLGRGGLHVVGGGGAAAGA